MALKNSNKHTFQRHIYTNGTSLGYDMIALAAEVEILTFDERFLNPKFIPKEVPVTPFKEIKWTMPYETCRDASLLKKQIPLDVSFNEFLVLLKNSIRQSILDFWNSKEKYVVLHSAGFDSRILSAILAELRDEGMVMDNVHFRCHQPECPGFFEIMKREGWRKDQYSCYEGTTEDYYNIGVPDISVNGFANYNQQMNFWHDIIPREEEKDWHVITGLNGEVFKYINNYKACTFRYCDNWGLNLVIDHVPGRGEWEGQWATRFKDMIMPYLGYKYLKVATRVNPQWCSMSKETDIVRFELSKLFPYNISEIPHGKHDYSWNISEERKKDMMNLYHKSKFFQRYNIEIDPFTSLYGWDAKMWGFGVTVYEHCYE